MGTERFIQSFTRLNHSATGGAYVRITLLIIILFLPPEGEVFIRGVRLCCEQLWNELENVHLHRHIIYQNDPMAKPDFMAMVPDLYRRRRRRQGRRRVPRHPPEPQGHLQLTSQLPTQCTDYDDLLNRLIY